MEHLSYDADDVPVFYFFFREQDPSMRSSAAAFRSILAQLLCRHSELQRVIDAFALALTSKSSGQLTATQEELQDLLLLLLDCVGDCVIVIDGLDECEDDDVFLSGLKSVVSESACHIILFSRPILRHGIAGKDGQALEIGLLNQDDIEVFLRRKLRVLIQNSYFPPKVDEELILQRLKLGSDGMFLWARLMTVYLQLPVLTRTQRVKTILEVNLPEGLEHMYNRLMGIINSKHRVERKFALLVLSLTTHAVRPLTCREMLEILTIPSLQDDENDGDYPDLHNTIMMACSGLIERATLIDPRYSTPTNTYRLIHLSAKDYFTSTDGVTNSASITRGSTTTGRFFSAAQAHFHFAIRCLRYLTYQFPAQQLTGMTGTASDPAVLDESFPLLNYATVYWTKHLQLIENINSAFRCVTSVPDQEDWYRECANSLTNFIRQKNVLMVWIESSYASKQPPSFKAVVQWMKPFGRDNHQELQKDSRDFEAYLKTLDEAWGPKLLASPSLLWEDILAFTPCRLLTKAVGMEVKSLISGRPKGRRLFPRHLCKISELTLDGRWVVILSVWPSKYGTYPPHRSTSC